jgi:hypothetical protein
MGQYNARMNSPSDPQPSSSGANDPVELFRGMKPGAAGEPELGPSARALGIRPGIDVPAQNPSDVVSPGGGGLSVSPHDPAHLPRHRRPTTLGGTGRDPIWGITTADLGPDLQSRPDPDNPSGHGFIEPSRPMTVAEFEQALERTVQRWKKIIT